MNSLFGPLGKKYCNLFLLLSAIALFFLISAVFTLFVLMLQKKVDFKLVLGITGGIVLYLIQYINNRILYNMCKSI